MFSALPVVILWWVPASTSGLTLIDTVARCRCAGDGRQSSSSGSDSTLKQAIPSLSASAISRAVLPTPENTILPAGTPAAKRPPQFPLRHDIHAGAEIGHGLDHRLVGIGLHRIANQVVSALEARLHDP